MLIVSGEKSRQTQKVKKVRKQTVESLEKYG